MQSLKQNIKNGLVTLGVIVALMAILLTPGFFNAGFLDPLVTSSHPQVLTGPAFIDIAGKSAEAVLGFMQNTSVR